MQALLQSAAGRRTPTQALSHWQIRPAQFSFTNNGTATSSGDSASLTLSGNYSGTTSSLTLSDESAIDLGTDSVFLHFTDLIMGLNSTLAIYNWKGTTAVFYKNENTITFTLYKNLHYCQFVFEINQECTYKAGGGCRIPLKK